MYRVSTCRLGIRVSEGHVVPMKCEHIVSKVKFFSEKSKFRLYFTRILSFNYILTTPMYSDVNSCRILYIEVYVQ